MSKDVSLFFVYMNKGLYICTMKEIICIDDVFHPEDVKNLPQRPVEGSLYTIRKLVRNPGGDYGLYVNELNNPKIKVDLGYGIILFEGNFKPQRFADLQGNILSEKYCDVIMDELSNVKEKTKKTDETFA